MSTTAIGLSDVPIEMLDRILDFLHDDAAALYSASLVGRNWVFAPRHHMFSRTILDVGLQDAPERHVASFLELSQSQHCTILPAIRCAIICIPNPELVGQVFKVLERAMGLSQIVFMQLDESESPVISWTTHMLSNVHDFTFNAMPTFGDEGWKLITSFPCLRTLAVYADPSKTIISLPRDISGSSFRSIRNLYLRLLQSEELLGWINNLEGFPLTRLETLDLRISDAGHKGWGSVKALNSFLKANSETMKHLNVGIHYGSGTRKDISNEEIDLSPLVNLRSLFMRTHDMNSICSSLSSLNSSSSLEVLTVQLLIPWEPDGFKPPSEPSECHCVFPELFTRFVTILDGRQFSGTRLDFQVPSSGFLGVQLSDLEYVFIKWGERGALKVSYTGYSHDMQRNTYGELLLQHLLWQHPRKMPSQPVFLR